MQTTQTEVTDISPWPNQTAWNILVGLANKIQSPTFFLIDREDYTTVLDVVVESSDHASVAWSYCKELTFAAQLSNCARVSIWDTFDRCDNIPLYDWSVQSVQDSQEYREWIDGLNSQDVETLTE